MPSALRGVRVSSDVFGACLTHALSTDQEEIMGLLLGDILPAPADDAFESAASVLSDRGGSVSEVARGSLACIWGVSIHERSERRSNRVEIGDVEMAQAAIQAEQVSTAMNKRTRVIGWYHSHPKITVIPSHVDVRTQAEHQRLDAGFIGLIFSVFGRHQGGGRTQMIAFQSIDTHDDAELAKHPDAEERSKASGQRYERVEIPIEIVDVTNVIPALLPSSSTSASRDTAGSSTNSNSNQVITTTTPITPREAKSTVLHSLNNLVLLQQTLYNEEQQTYLKVLRTPTTAPIGSVSVPVTSSSSGDMDVVEKKRHSSPPVSTSIPPRKQAHQPQPVCHPLTALHANGVYLKTLSKVLEYGCTPLLQELAARVAANNRVLLSLTSQNDKYRLQLAALAASSSSPSSSASTSSLLRSPSAPAPPAQRYRSVVAATSSFSTRQVPASPVYGDDDG